RHPVIKRVLETTDFLTKVMGVRQKFAQVLRDAVIPVVSRLAPFHRALVRRLSQLDIAHRGSPTVEGDGGRYFGASKRCGEGIGSRFLIVIGDDTDSPTTVAMRQLLGSFNDVVEVRRLKQQGLKLVRPDGYVAYATNGRGGVGALASLRSVLIRQTN